MPNNIFQLALNFYRAPTQFGDLLDSSQAVPQGVDDLLKFLAGSDQERKTILSRYGSLSGSGELIDAISYFVEEVLFLPGADYYRLMGLQPDASAEQVRDHYQVLIGLFYQDDEHSVVNWNEADSMRINQAYSVLRDVQKRHNYDDRLLAEGRQFTRFDPASYKNLDRKRSAPRSAGKDTGNAIAADHNRLAEDSARIRAGHKRELKEAARLESETKSGKKEPVTLVAPVEGGLAKSIAVDALAGEKDLPKILICDDSATVRASLAKALADDFRCLRARNGDEGLRMLQDNPDIQLVLTDLEMPEMDGYELIANIRKDNDLRRANLPIVVVTSMTDIKAKQKALGAGASDFLAKGTDYVEILARVRVHYRLAQSMVNQAVNTEAEAAPAKTGAGDKIRSLIDVSRGPEVAPRERDLPEKTVAVNVSAEPSKIPQSVIVGAGSLLAVAVIAFLFSSGGDKEQSNTAEGPATGQEKTIQTLEGSGVINRLPDSQEELDPSPAVAQESAAVEEKTSVAVADVPTEVKAEPKAVKPKATTTSKPAPARVVAAKPAKPARQAEPAKAQEPAPISVKPGVLEKDTAADEVVNLVNEEALPQVATSSVARRQAEPVVVAEPKEKIEPPVVAEVTAPVIKPLDTKVPAKVPETVIAKVEREPAVPRSVISQRELSILMFKFVRAYEEGNLFQFLGLFDSEARTEDRVGISEIRKDYELLFERSDVRQFVITDLNWTHDGRQSIGKGKFEVKIKARGGDSLNSYAGQVTFHVIKRSDEVLISELYHTYSK